MWTDARTPYNDLPALPPALEVVENVSVLKATVAAGRALAQMDGAAARLPDPAILSNLIPLLESQASNEIENIVTTNDELFRAAHGVPTPDSPQIREALRYRRALEAGMTALEKRPLTASTATAVCAEILGHEVQVRTATGTYIGRAGSRTPIYTPPVGKERMLAHLSAWEKFLHDHGDIDPLIAMALLHYQFEAIHPFSDGNGRTGRILNVLFLVHSKLLTYPILYLSGYIVRNKDHYYRLLRGVTERGEWAPWITFMLDAVAVTSNWTYTVIDQSVRLQGELEDDIRAALPTNAPAISLARLLMSTPYLRIETVADRCAVHRQTAARWLNSLADNGIVLRETRGRNAIFINQKLLSLLFNTPLAEKF